MKKLICVDIDGTVLGHSGVINPAIFDYFEKCDHKLIIASGRPLNEIRKFGFDCDCIASNGAEIVKDGKLIKRETLNDDVVRELYPHFVEEFQNVTVSTEKGRYLNSDVDIDNLVLAMVMAFNGSFNQKMFDKIKSDYTNCAGYVTDIDSFLQADHQISKLESTTSGSTTYLLDNFNKRNDFEAFSSIGGHLEIVPPNVNKAEGVKEYLRDEHYQIFAIGDGDNDIELFEFADVSFAMENGTEKLKQVATHHTASVDNDGFLKAMKYIELNY